MRSATSNAMGAAFSDAISVDLVIVAFAPTAETSLMLS
jgi:hypothetical protein